MKDKDINDDTDESIFLDYSINTKNNVEEASLSLSFSIQCVNVFLQKCFNMNKCF